MPDLPAADDLAGLEARLRAGWAKRETAAAPVERPKFRAGIIKVRGRTIIAEVRGSRRVAA